MLPTERRKRLEGGQETWTLAFYLTMIYSQLELVLQVADGHGSFHAALDGHLHGSAVLLKQEVPPLWCASSDHKHSHCDVNWKTTNIDKPSLIFVCTGDVQLTVAVLCMMLWPHGAVRVLPLIKELRGFGHTGRIVSDAGEQQQVTPEHSLRHWSRVSPLLPINQTPEQIHDVALRNIEDNF